MGYLILGGWNYVHGRKKDHKQKSRMKVDQESLLRLGGPVYFDPTPYPELSCSKKNDTDMENPMGFPKKMIYSLWVFLLCPKFDDQFVPENSADD